RLRALYLEASAIPSEIHGPVLASVKSFLVLLRHLLALRGTHPGPRYHDALDAGERAVGPLPAMRHLLSARDTGDPRTLRTAFPPYLEAAGRMAAALAPLEA